MYVKGENWEMALESFLLSHQWQQVFCMTSRLGYSSNKEAEVARKLAGCKTHSYIFSFLLFKRYT